MIIIDASIATKLINTQEEESDRAEKLLLSHIEGKEEIIIPSLLFLEVANALATKSKISEDLIKKGLHLLYEANFLIYEAKEKDLIEAALLAKKYRTSVYDMLYAVIAKNKNIILVTSDNKFVNKVNLPFLRLLSKLDKI